MLLLLWLLPNAYAANDILRIGSKRFTESYILGDILTQTAAPYTQVLHRQGLGSTAIVFEALKSGDIDIYPEYTGTIDQEILGHRHPTSLAQINRELARFGIGAAVPLGFNNTYALAMRDADSRRRNVSQLSDLALQPDLRLGLSHEFLGRNDGWPGLAQRYHLPQQPIGLDHGLAYEALADGQVDVIDIYSTDAKIRQYQLHVLADNDQYFPRYDAVLLYRLDVPHRFPRAWRALQGLRGRISEADMTTMNAAAELEGKSFSAVAHDFLTHTADNTGQHSGFWGKLFDGDLWRLSSSPNFTVKSI